MIEGAGFKDNARPIEGSLFVEGMRLKGKGALPTPIPVPNALPRPATAGSRGVGEGRVRPPSGCLPSPSPRVGGDEGIGLRKAVLTFPRDGGEVTVAEGEVTAAAEDMGPVEEGAAAEGEVTAANGDVTVAESFASAASEED